MIVDYSNNNETYYQDGSFQCQKLDSQDPVPCGFGNFLDNLVIMNAVRLLYNFPFFLFFPIIIAIGVIVVLFEMFFFKERFNFFKNNKFLTNITTIRLSVTILILVVLLLVIVFTFFH